MEKEFPKKMTGKEFADLIKLQPNFCKKLKEPLEIYTFCDLKETKITCLSPLLTFNGKNKEGNVADLSCQGENLTTIEGTFQGGLDISYFQGTEIKAIITKPNNKGTALIAPSCTNIKELTGSYPGKIILRDCKELTNTSKVTVLSTDQQNWAAVFTGCEKLEEASGTYAGFVSWSFCPIKTSKGLKITKPNIQGDYLNIDNKKLKRKITEDLLKKNNPQQELL